jgi:hypothetical protein
MVYLSYGKDFPMGKIDQHPGPALAFPGPARDFDQTCSYGNLSAAASITPLFPSADM